MRVAVYTLTRDRLEYTKHCFATLQKNAGVPFDHYVIDNNSTDGTVEWLRDEYKPFFLQARAQNCGISRAANHALNAIFSQSVKADMVCKFDNDCEVVSENLLGQMLEILQATPRFGPRYVLSPRVEGIVNQPTRVRDTMLGGRRIGLTAIVGGLCHCVPADVYMRYRYPENLPLGWGQDDNFCQWARDHGCEVGYVEGLTVNHYETTDGQAKKFPSYFERKWREDALAKQQRAG